MGEALKRSKKNTAVTEIEEHWLEKYLLLVFQVLKMLESLC